MSRVLEIVLWLSLDAWQVKSGSRARGEPRDFGAELVRAWRICPQVRMRRGHERVTIEPCQVEEAEPSPGECWWTWIESNAQGRRVVASRTKAFAPGVMARERFDAEHAGIAVATPLSAPAPPADAQSAQATGEAMTPGPVDEAAVAASSGPAPLRLVAERRRGRWADDSGVVVEMTLDDLTLHGGADLPRRHVELRLAAPDWETVPARTAALRALFAAARELSGAWPAFVQLTSVIDRACAGEPGVTGPVKAKLVDLTGIRTQRTALFALSGDIAAQWLGNEGGVLDRDDPEFVHQMRVALRRLRTLMRFFPRFADDQWQETFGVDLRWLASLLGTVRDWDVFSTESLPALIAADGGSADWNGTLDAARAQATAARIELRQALHSARYARLTLGWLEWLSTLALPPAASDDDAPSLRRHATKRVRRLFGHLYASPSLTSLDTAARHQVRIDTKRLRYALEFFASLASRRTRNETVKTLARVQSVLGEANDTMVAQHHLEQLAAPAYQLGFVRGYGAALEQRAARDAEALLASLRPPRLDGKPR
ncbi:CHAD domain protein [Burkholderia ambifaria AMMD]|uniref:CHAD domain containing protein n=1 Tax=Burkholderia ambifaria (strain ATCC BAA-244 / DSM 16087 / CCUG 44356 / LMG 19182 / AMMD) TaxID=339670 RepID=Q0BAP3_BURCM|nr:CHAD domain-containing protein [Burkholderia ambifaria]ABI88780.1 CHAD domain containing protein [Burkholderia ambifaria AMMD]AJY24043.1 CHAD domain protein [Burkholderia ambifaria AMMD]MBR7934988.1 CHAD domain-containing protein [Burkholderia ambifaria]PEH69093.1 CHAD domain-containing protein [Burkholderia ambifaria]QQC06313.1 CHAD domain-containing protein [Burkholderia ambifaria]